MEAGSDSHNIPEELMNADLSTIVMAYQRQWQEAMEKTFLDIKLLDEQGILLDEALTQEIKAEKRNQNAMEEELNRCKESIKAYLKQLEE